MWIQVLLLTLPQFAMVLPSNGDVFVADLMACKIGGSLTQPDASSHCLEPFIFFCKEVSAGLSPYLEERCLAILLCRPSLRSQTNVLVLG